jgi:hypothetical protein
MPVSSPSKLIFPKSGSINVETEGLDLMPKNVDNHFIFGLTTKAEPPPTRGVDCNRSGNGGWLRRLP